MLSQLRVKYGVIAGAAYVVMVMILYSIGYEMLASPLKAILYWITWVLIVVLAIRARKESVNYLGYGEALLTVFVMIAIAELMYTAFYFVLANYIDPELNNRLLAIAIEKLETSLASIGAGDARIDEMIDQIQGQEASFTVWNAFKSLLTYWFVGFLVSLLAAIMVRKKRPVFDEFE
jgi:hypothetical protein